LLALCKRKFLRELKLRGHSGHLTAFCFRDLLGNTAFFSSAGVAVDAADALADAANA
jgi:hypothetical protein